MQDKYTIHGKVKFIIIIVAIAAIYEQVYDNTATNQCVFSWNVLPHQCYVA